MHILMIFLDGIGLGDDDPAVNPFAVANMPTLTALTNGKRWLRDTGKQESERAIFIPTDPRLGIPGRPQSATGHAAILTGLNVPQLIGEHYGPKPDARVRQYLADEHNIFKQVVNCGKQAALINAYPPRLHQAINRGKSLRSSIQQAAHEAGLPMFEDKHLYSGEAMSEDWTGEAWRTHLDYTDTPLFTPYEAGVEMVRLSRQYDFAFFSHWFTDTVGHRGPFEDAVGLLELFDGVMTGAMDTWDDDEGLMLVTSDHGNMEVIGDRHHTENDVPTLIVGREKAAFAEGFTALTDFVPRMAKMLCG